jgi:radical SAM protein with 4Fe4S-binding SPASM domain
MTLDVAAAVLDRIHEVNPSCQLNISGGEPLGHPGLLEILGLVERRRHPWVLLTNGTLLDRAMARHLGGARGLRYVHLSIDGLSAASHERTRGKGHHAKVMAALDALITEEVPFVLAPTIHEGNLHELPAMAELAFRSGGWISPNQLRQLPHPGLDFTGLDAGPETVLETLRVINGHLIEQFGRDEVETRAARFSEQVLCAAPRPNTRLVCGMAHSLIDVDWNGDVYPCHLLKDPALVLGNLAEEGWEQIHRRTEARGLRVRSTEIPRCSTCTFVSTCGGGCRAGAWYHFGTLQHEDDACELNYAARVRRAVRTVARPR